MAAMPFSSPLHYPRPRPPTPPPQAIKNMLFYPSTQVLTSTSTLAQTISPSQPTLSVPESALVRSKSDPYKYPTSTWAPPLAWMHTDMDSLASPTSVDTALSSVGSKTDAFQTPTQLPVLASFPPLSSKRKFTAGEVNTTLKSGASSAPSSPVGPPRTGVRRFSLNALSALKTRPTWLRGRSSLKQDPVEEESPRQEFSVDERLEFGFASGAEVKKQQGGTMGSSEDFTSLRDPFAPPPVRVRTVSPPASRDEDGGGGGHPNDGGGGGLCLRIWGWGAVPIPAVRDVGAMRGVEVVGGGGKKSLSLKRKKRGNGKNKGKGKGKGGAGGGDEDVDMETVREDAVLAHMLWRRLTRDCEVEGNGDANG